MCKQKLFVVAAAVIGIISLFLPFVKVAGMSANALSDGGALGYTLMVMFGISLLLALLGKPTSTLKKGSVIGIIVCAAIALLFLILNITNLGGMGLGVLGIGFWIALLASIALPVGIFVFKCKCK